MSSQKGFALASKHPAASPLLVLSEFFFILVDERSPQADQVRDAITPKQPNQRDSPKRQSIAQSPAVLAGCGLKGRELR